jgi:hypothetical protein
MAELVRIFHGVTTAEARDTIDALVERKSPVIWEVEGVKRVLDPYMSAKDKVLMHLHHSTGWVPVADLCKWVEYSNASMFRRVVLKPLHHKRLIEFDAENGRAKISPSGAKVVEDKLRAK